MSNDISEIDKAIAAAQARKAAKAGASGSSDATATPAKAKAPKEPKAPKRPRLTDEEKAARTAAKEAERAAKKAARDAARAAKKAEREANKRTPHMSKVDKAAARLPSLGDKAQVAVNDITANFSAIDVAAIAAYLQHFNRVKATERALAQNLNVGDTVRIVSGDARYIGLSGTVTKAQRIRCYVDVPASKKPVYLFTSDVEVTAAAPAAKTA